MTETIIRPSAPASGRVTPASFPFYTTGEDNLRVTSWNAAAGVKLKINGRTIDAAGKATPNSWDHTPNTDRSAATSDIVLSGSTVLNLTVFVNAGSPQIGQTFVKVELIRGIGAAAIVLGTLLQGYATAAQALGFPGSPLQSSLDGGGYFRTIVGTTPGAGSAITETCPAGARWEMRCFSFSYQISNSGVARPLAVQFKDVNNKLIGGALTPISIPINTTSFAVFSANFVAPSNQVPDGNYFLYSSLPYPLILQAGGKFTVPNPFGTDTYLGPTYEVLEWLEP